MNVLGQVECAEASSPVLAEAMTRDGLVARLRELIDARYPPKQREDYCQRLHWADFHNAVSLFDEFLQQDGAERIGITEELVDAFQRYLCDKKHDPRGRYARTKTSRIRVLINSLPSEARLRRLLSPREVRGTNRFAGLSAETQTILRNFLRDGRKLVRSSSYDKPVLSQDLLSKRNRENIADHARRFLSKLGATDLLDVTDGDVDDLLMDCADEQERQALVDQLSDLRSLYAYIIGKGIASISPLHNIGGKKWHVNHDYVPPDQIARLQDLATVDMDDVWDVRDRLVCVGLCYDFGLRNMEVCGLAVSDIKVDQFVELLLRPENQKGQRKRERLFMNFFPATKELMSRYLRLREKLNPSTDRLIVSQAKNHLLRHGCAALVTRHCQRLGVSTAEGKVPAPHRFRHSFGTLNIAPLGLKLDPYDIMSRLRHSSLDTTLRIYVAENPLLDRAKHQAKMSQLQLQGRSQAEESVASGDMVLPEADAMRALAKFDLTPAALRKYALHAGVGCRTGLAHCYSRGFVDRLGREWTTKREAMDTLGIGSTGFFYWVRRNGIETKVIGKICLVRLEDVVRAVARKRSARCRTSA